MAAADLEEVGLEVEEAVTAVEMAAGSEEEMAAGSGEDWVEAMVEGSEAAREVDSGEVDLEVAE